MYVSLVDCWEGYVTWLASYESLHQPWHELERATSRSEEGVDGSHGTFSFLVL